MLGMVSRDLPVYLNYEIAFFTLDCVGEGILSQFHVMQIVSRVVNALRNSRSRNVNQNR